MEAEIKSAGSLKPQRVRIMSVKQPGDNQIQPRTSLSLLWLTGAHLAHIALALVQLPSSAPPMPLARNKTVIDAVLESGDFRDDGRLDALAAALSGRAWLVAIAKAQKGKHVSLMAENFDLHFYDKVLAEAANESAEAEGNTADETESDDADLDPLSELQRRFRKCEPILPRHSGTPLSVSLPSPKRVAQQSSQHIPAHRRCIEVGITVPSDEVGCYACHPNDYAAFWPFFDKASPSNKFLASLALSLAVESRAG